MQLNCTFITELIIVAKTELPNRQGPDFICLGDARNGNTGIEAEN